MDSEVENPYAPPATPLAVAPSSFDMAEHYEAGNGKRFLNWLIDRIAIICLGVVTGALLGILYSQGITGPTEMLQDMGMIGEYLTGYLLTVGYYFAMEGAFGLTLGKLVTGTRVVDDTGKKPSWAVILGRTLARIVPFEPFSFLGDRGWHDSWSDTRVIDVRHRGPRLSPGLRKIYARR